MTNDPTEGYPVNPDWAIGEVISSAWSKVSGYKATLWLAMLIYIGVQIALSFVLSLFFEAPAEPGGSSPADVFVALATFPMMYMMMVMGLRRARSEAVQATNVLDGYSSYLPLLGLFLLTTILTLLGFLLLVLPGIYLAVAYSMAPILMLERGMGVWEAMETSRKVVTRCWFKAFLLGLAMFVIIALSAIPFGIGLVWTLPLGYIVGGELYGHLFGDDSAQEEAGDVPPTPPQGSISA
jgi:hypothetical protein